MDHCIQHPRSHTVSSLRFILDVMVWKINLFWPHLTQGSFWILPAWRDLFDRICQVTSVRKRELDLAIQRPGRTRPDLRCQHEFLRWVAGSRCEYSLPWAFPQERNTNGRISMTWTKLQLPLTCVQTKPCKALCNHSSFVAMMTFTVVSWSKPSSESARNIKSIQTSHPFSYQLLASNNLLEESAIPR